MQNWCDIMKFQEEQISDKKWMLPQRAHYPVVLEIKKVVVWVSTQKIMFGVRCIKSAGVQKLKYCGELMLHGRSTWDLCVGRRTGVWGRKAFFDQAEYLKVALVLCVWMIDSSETEYNRILRQGMVSGQIIEGIYPLCSYGSDDLAMLFLFLTLFPIYFVLCILPVIVFSCCFSPDMFNPTTQSSLDVFLLLQRVPGERSKEGRCIWLWKMIWCHLQRK